MDFYPSAGQYPPLVNILPWSIYSDIDHPRDPFCPIKFAVASVENNIQNYGPEYMDQGRRRVRKEKCIIYG